MGKEISNLQTSISGAITGVSTGILTNPLDVVKIRMQLQKSTNSAIKYKGTFHGLGKVIKEEGISALWKGNISAQYLHFSYGAIQFYYYERCMSYFKKMNDEKKYNIPPHFQTFVSGALAGATAVIATYPFDLLRTRFSAQGNYHVYKNTVQATKIIIRNEGISSLYKGVVPSVLSIVPYIGTSFLSHDFFMQNLDSLQEKYPDKCKYLTNGVKNFISGGFAGVVSKTVTMPLDTIRKVMQVNGEIAQSMKNVYAVDIQENKSKRLFSCMKNVYKKEGIQGFYKGLGPSMIKSTYGTAMTFLIMNECQSFFKWWNNRENTKKELE